ncbi:MAG: relaxase domain-containing protein [Acidobacteriales bacterium]|nr:relaxase domain-containing protein [Terriglobales bacterium]
MLTISRAISASQAQSYHVKEFTAKEQNYWSREQAIVGEWQGRLAATLGLVGTVDPDHFARLSQGQHPISGEQLVQQRASHQYKDEHGKLVTSMEHRAGWDATFSAPKSVSLTALAGGDERVRIAHREAVAIALRELEAYTLARIGGIHFPETTGRFIAAKFEHDTARPVDGYSAPQLHTHAIIFNLTQRENGASRAIQERALFQSQQFATAVYQSELTYRLSRLGYEIVTGKSGAPGIRGYTQEYLDASSPRSQQIREYMEKLGVEGKTAAQIAAHATRDRKQNAGPEATLAAHQRLAEQFGNQPQKVVSGAQHRSLHHACSEEKHRMSKAHQAITFARNRIFERESVADERHIFRDALRRGMGEVTYADVRRALETRLSGGEFQLLQSLLHSPARQITTEQMVALEREVISTVIAGRSQVAPILTHFEAQKYVEDRPFMNEAQCRSIEQVLASSDRIQGIQGSAGSGKTMVLAAIRQSAEASGYFVEGLAPTSRAAHQLRDSGVEAVTLQRFLARGEAAGPPPPRKSFFVVDESSLASTRQVVDLLHKLGPEDRVLLVGDIRQHQAVDAGKPFEQLQKAGMQTATLDMIIRQKDPGLLNAVTALARGEVPAAIALLTEQGRVLQYPDKNERYRAIAKEYVNSDQRTLVISPDNLSRRELNEQIRFVLRERGRIGLDSHTFKVPSRPAIACGRFLAREPTSYMQPCRMARLPMT